MSITTKRISSSHFTNIGKKKFLIDHFNQVKNLKNNISYYLFKTFQSDIDFNSIKYELESTHYKKFNGILTSWETQKLFKSIVDFYFNQIQQRTRNEKIMVQNKIEVQYYKKNGKTHKKGDIKYYHIVMKNTEISNIINYMKYLPEKDLNTFKFSKNKHQDEEKDSKKIKENKKKTRAILTSYNKKLKKLRESETKWRIFKNIIKLHKKKLRDRLSLIQFSSGSYIKAAEFNKNSKKPTSHSYIFLSNTKKFKRFYNFKYKDGEIRIPLTENEKYHQFDFKEYDLKKEHYVNYKNGKIHIGLTTQKDTVYYIENGLKVGIDINVRDNFMSLSDGQIFDYDRGYIHELVKELHRLDNLSKKEKETKANKKKLKKIINRNEWYFKKLISEILSELSEKGFSDIVLEDLDLSKSSASFVKDEKLNMKYSRIIRILRLSNIKVWFKRQAENYGIRVHLTNPAYTSQECSTCHFISRLNRNGAYFECKNCGHKEHSDLNSPKSIYNRVYYSEVLKNDLHIYDDDKRLIPKKMAHKKIKLILEKTFPLDKLLLSA